MTERHPVVERYLTHLQGAIGELDPADRREVLEEIRNHIAEAAAAGKPIDVVLGALGRRMPSAGHTPSSCCCTRRTTAGRRPPTAG